MHTYHNALPDYDPESILHDGCPRCEARAGAGIAGLLQLDANNLELLWRRCLNEEFSGSNGGEDAGFYRSHCERTLGHNLYLVGVLLQNRDDVWRPERFAASAPPFAKHDSVALDEMNLLLSASEWPGASGMEDVLEIVRATGRAEVPNAPVWETH